MKMLMVKQIPAGEFEEVSIGAEFWKLRLENIIKLRKPFMYRTTQMPNLSMDTYAALSQQGYTDHILIPDQIEHYLVPPRFRA